MAAKLDAPIPGQSLTTEPGNAPWEQPPLKNTPEEALQYYLERFEDEEVLDETLFVLDQGFPLSVLVDSLTTVGVMEGIHTIDVSTLISPILHEYIVALGAAAGIEVVEHDGPTKAERLKAKEKKRLLIMLENLDSEIGDDLKEGLEATTDGGLTAPIEKEIPSEEKPTEDPAAPPKGFINRKM